MRITRASVLKAVLTLGAWILALLWISPFLGIVMVSLRPVREVLHGWWVLTPFTFTWENFVNAWTGQLGTYPLYVGIRNSLIIATFSTILPLTVGALAAYAFARFSFPIKNLLFLTITLLMAMPPQVIAIPLFFLMSRLRLVNTYLGLVLVHSAWGTPWIILFLRNYFMTLPKELEEAARIDGASDFEVFCDIVLPLCKPALLSIVALQFTWVWNDFFFALILMMHPENYVATQCLVFMKGEYHVPWGLISAGSVITMAFPILLFFLLQKYYVRGMVGWLVRG